MGVRPVCIVNTLVPFSTRLADDGLVHLRVWRAPDGPLAVVAELDWALMTGDREDAYFGPGIFTYPHYALPAAAAAWEAAGVPECRVYVRLPDPPGERFARVTDPEDPQGWEPVDADHIGRMVGDDQWPGPPVGRYTRRVVHAWITDGRLSPR